MTVYLFLLIGSLVTITCLYLVVEPFFTRKLENISVAEVFEQDMSLESIYQAINEIEMDLLMKKITKPDYQQMKEKYAIMAADYLNSQPIMTEDPKQQLADTTLIEHQILGELAKIRSEKGFVKDE
jgi:hypothetical protein